MIRGIFTWLMIFGFGFVIYMGPLVLVLLVSIDLISDIVLTDLID